MTEYCIYSEIDHLDRLQFFRQRDKCNGSMTRVLFQHAQPRKHAATPARSREGPNSISSAIKQESPHDFYFKAPNVKIRPWSPEQEQIRRTVLPVLGQQIHFPELSQTRRSVVAELFVACEVRDAVGWGGGDKKCVFAICRGCGQDRMENFYKQQLYKFFACYR